MNKFYVSSLAIAGLGYALLSLQVCLLRPMRAAATVNVPAIQQQKSFVVASKL